MSTRWSESTPDERIELLQEHQELGEASETQLDCQGGLANEERIARAPLLICGVVQLAEPFDGALARFEVIAKLLLQSQQRQQAEIGRGTEIFAEPLAESGEHLIRALGDFLELTQKPICFGGEHQGVQKVCLTDAKAPCKEPRCPSLSVKQTKNTPRERLLNREKPPLPEEIHC